MTTQAKVLVVDDEPALLHLMRNVLGDQGYHVETASNGYEALAACHRLEPDLVVLDVRMPKDNGCRVSRAIKSWADLNPGKRGPGVLLVTGHPFGEPDGDSLDLSQADAVLPKPFSNREFLEQVARLLSGGS